MYFESLETRLLAHIRAKVVSGEVTERGLARLTGISQPHLHNVLKGVRSLSIEMADQIMRRLRITVVDLMEEKDLAGLAPLLIQVGAAETLLDDAIRLAKLAGAADVHVELQIWPEMVHVWHLFHPEVTAGKRAIEAGGAFVRAQTAG